MLFLPVDRSTEDGMRRWICCPPQARFYDADNAALVFVDCEMLTLHEQAIMDDIEREWVIANGPRPERDLYDEEW